jgi:hypothetical protein
MAGRNGVEDVPDLNIRRNMMDAEQGVDVASTGVALQVRWKDRKDGDWVKKTEKAEQAASDTEYFRLFPGFRSSGND